NVIENAPRMGIVAGFGPYLRNVNITGNVVRKTDIGVAVSVVHGAGPAMIANNLIAGVRQGAIVGMEWHNAVTSDLARGGGERYPQLSIHGNQVS
ncbi:MAG TPA: TIGR03808 family TAT-translocated repetitive protein, partial [Pseudolabrys sp.]|nr:TIGR03808 family TAT-translocated repetitive protein [Pseudolabrys sp.]